MMEKIVKPGIVEPWPELESGSKNLIYCRIFGFAKLIVGSAAKATDPEGKKTKADPYRKRFACC